MSIRWLCMLPMVMAGVCLFVCRSIRLMLHWIYILDNSTLISYMSLTCSTTLANISPITFKLFLKFCAHNTTLLWLLWRMASEWDRGKCKIALVCVVLTSSSFVSSGQRLVTYIVLSASLFLAMTELCYSPIIMHIVVLRHKHRHGIFWCFHVHRRLWCLFWLNLRCSFYIGTMYLTILYV